MAGRAVSAEQEHPPTALYTPTTAPTPEKHIPTPPETAHRARVAHIMHQFYRCGKTHVHTQTLLSASLVMAFLATR